MNRIFRLLLIFTCLMGGLLIAVAAHSYPYVELLADRNDWRIGDAFAVQVVARGLSEGDEVAAFGFDVHYEWRGLLFTGATMGPGFDDVSDLLPGTRVAGLHLTSEPDSFFSEKILEPILLASLNFECLSIGKFLLGIASDPDSKDEGLFIYPGKHLVDIFAGLEVNVAPVPIPLPHFLLASGVIALAICRWARREP